MMIKFKKFIIVFMCLVLIINTFSNFPAVAANENNDLKIIHDGNLVSQISISKSDTLLLKIESEEEELIDYQWQILINNDAFKEEETETWATIQGHSNEPLNITYAMVCSQLDSENKTKVRACATNKNDLKKISNIVEINVIEEDAFDDTISETVTQKETNEDTVQIKKVEDVVEKNTTQKNEMTTSSRTFAVPAAHTNDVEEIANVDSEYVTITINYKFEEGITAFEPYLATLVKGTSFTSDVASPSIIGYEPVTVDSDGNNKDAAVISLDYSDGVNEDIIIDVVYRPALVNYAVKYFFQNIFDDLYSENTSESVINAKGYTGEKPDSSYFNKAYDGYSVLNSDRDTIAADGSSEYHVYYNRNYYLMNFILDGGYGVEPIYAKYGSSFVVNNPIKHGYVFSGWDLLNENNVGDGVADELPDKIPAHNRNYKALWKAEDTSYQIVYWLKNADDENYDYVGSRKERAVSSTKVSGEDDLTNDVSVCGIEEHSHSEENGCYQCNIDSHIHSINCYATQGYTESANLSNTELTVFNLLKDKISVAQEGYVYKYAYRSGWITTRYNYFYFQGEWYYLGTEGSYGGVSLSDTLINPAIDGYASVKAVECSATGGGSHTHSKDCLVCSKELHSHNKNCTIDTSYYEFVTADKDIIVNGDGSSIVNVYYARRQYTLKFYYAKEEDGKYYVCGNSTEFANGDGIVDQLTKTASYWGQVKTLPTIASTDEIDVSIYKTGYDEYTIKNKKGKYYYLEFTEDYDSDISNKWPVGIFERVETSSTFDYGNYAYFSAWNVDSNSWYDNQYSNKTLKGNYQRLDYKMLMNNNLNQTTINFLGFWENGTTGLGWNKPHKWNYNVYIPVLEGSTEYDKEYNGIKYELYGAYVVYDNNTSATNTLYCDQTPTALEGFTISHYDAYKIETYDTRYGLETHQIDFYYTRNSDYSLTFYNHGTIDDKKSQNNIYFETSLSDYYYIPDYPETLEENAYAFEGWYTSPGCYDGTEVDWQTLRMPASDLMLYAKWVPNEHTVTVYETYNDVINNNSIYAEFVVSHGNTVNPPKTFANPTKDKYTFMGWFYIDDGLKVAFDFQNIAVTKDLVIFADWSSDIIANYNIEYIYKDPDGNEIEIADSTVGSTFAGNTKTFKAKSSSELYEGYTSHYYPKTNTHSIFMVPDSNDNTFKFEYVYLDKVPYTVRYVNKITGEELLEDKYVADNRAGVVTEKFSYVKDYIPDSYYKKLVLSATERENVITFYYVPDSEHAYYAVHHYIQDTDGGYSEYAVIEGVGNVGNKIVADKLSIAGFTFNSALSSDEGYINTSGLKLDLYYDRNTYGYTVNYLEYGTNKKLQESITGTAEYGSTISRSAISINGYTLVGNEDISIEIKENSTLNVINFYYRLEEATIQYKVVVAGSGNTASCNVSLSQEIVNSSDSIIGSTPIVTNKNYKFDYWYIDKECTVKVDENLVDDDGKLTPELKTAVYYAKFVPLISNLKITNTGANMTVDEHQSFLYLIKGVAGTSTEDIELTVSIHGNESIIIGELPVGKYTVEEKTDWSFRYTPDNKIKDITLTSELAINELNFNHSRDFTKWLDGNSYRVNVFD